MKENHLKDKIEIMQKNETKELHLACKKLCSQKPVSNLADILNGLFAGTA